MEIRKLFKFNNIHIVRNCTSNRCKHSAHAHTYHIELFLTSDRLDNGGMAVDFGILKNSVKQVIKMFDNSYSLWSREKDDYKNFVNQNYENIFTLNFNPSAELYSVFFYKTLKNLIKNHTKFNNNEGNIKVEKVIVHETNTGYDIADENCKYLSNNTDILNYKGIEKEGYEIYLKLKNDPNFMIENEKPEQQV